MSVLFALLVFCVFFLTVPWVGLQSVIVTFLVILTFSAKWWSDVRFSLFSEMCLVQPDPALYSFINQGVLTVDSIDDTEEMKLTDVSCFPYIL